MFTTYCIVTVKISNMFLETFLRSLKNFGLLPVSNLPTKNIVNQCLAS